MNKPLIEPGSLAEAHQMYGSYFLHDAEVLATHHPMHLYDVTAIVDAGFFQQHVMLATDPPHPAAGMHSTGYFAIGHAIELLLKSYLLAKGITEDDLKEIGHSLTKAIDQAESLGLDFEYAPEIRDFNSYHEKLLFRYPRQPLLPGASLKDLILAATDLQKTLQEM